MRLLVIRTSSMGDVALTTPVLLGMREQFPDSEIFLITGRVFSPFFTSIKGLDLILPDFKRRHSGFLGLIRLFINVRQHGKFDHVIDLHDVLRSKVLRQLFRLSGVKVSVIDKGRREKKKLTKGKNKKELKHIVERYCDTFARAGFRVVPVDNPAIIASDKAKVRAGKLMGDNSETVNIGVAPFAKHKLKVWPESNMIRLLELISEKREVKFWLFGGTEESEKLEELCSKAGNSFNVTGKLNLDEELALMADLDLMIAMDSSNMHMASLAGTKVISIWGGTDPITGFGAWHQPEKYTISISHEDLTCRPCTVYGKGKCHRGDFACMNWLTPEIVFKKIESTGLLAKQ